MLPEYCDDDNVRFHLYAIVFQASHNYSTCFKINYNPVRDRHIPASTLHHTEYHIHPITVKLKVQCF